MIARAVSADRTVAPAPPPVPEPSRLVAADTRFAPDALYRVRLSAVADYLGTPLSPMHLHEVTGTVAEALRDRIAAFDPV